MESKKKYNKLVNITKKSHRLTDVGDKRVDTSVGAGRGKTEVGWKAQMAEYKAQGYIVPHGKYCQYIATTANRKNLKVV